MADIEIVKRRDRASMFSKTSVGRKWMLDNLPEHGPVFTFDANLVEDMVASLQKDDIEVEVI